MPPPAGRNAHPFRLQPSFLPASGARRHYPVHLRPSQIMMVMGAPDRPTALPVGPLHDAGDSQCDMRPPQGKQ